MLEIKVYFYIKRVSATGCTDKEYLEQYSK